MSVRCGWLLTKQVTTEIASSLCGGTSVARDELNARSNESFIPSHLVATTKRKNKHRTSLKQLLSGIRNSKTNTMCMIPPLSPPVICHENLDNFQCGADTLGCTVQCSSSHLRLRLWRTSPLQFPSPSKLTSQKKLQLAFCMSRWQTCQPDGHKASTGHHLPEQ